MTKILITVALLLTSISCGFATDATSEYTNIDVVNPVAYKYKKTIEGPCTFNVSIFVNIPDNYGHWKDNLHQMSVLFGNNERSKYSLWNELSISIPCAACNTEGIKGMISVLDSKDHLVPWGCGQERPPLQNIKAVSTFLDLEKVPEEGWGDFPPTTWERSFAPELMNNPMFCDGEYVLFDLTPACEVLVDAGLMEKE